MKSPSSNTTSIKMIINGDPHMEFIPQALINYIIKKVLPVGLKLLMHKANSIPKVYFDLMEEKKEFYDHVFSRICSMFKEVAPITQ